MNRRKFLQYCQSGIITLFLSGGSFGQKNKSLEERIFPLYEEINRKFNLEHGESALLVDGENQKLHLVDGLDEFKINKTYNISTGKYGFGNERGSYKTPLGIHRIGDMHGEGEPFGTIFISRQSTRRIATIHYNKMRFLHSPITSRILELDGCEEKNKNSQSRLIYIHGTSEEGLIGEPVSDGCIRMKNSDIIELYNLVKVGTYLNIKDRV